MQNTLRKKSNNTKNLHFQDADVIETKTRRSKRLQESQSIITEVVAVEEEEEGVQDIEEEGVQEIHDEPSDDERQGMEGLEMDEVHEKTPEPEDEARFPTPKKMWRRRLSQETEEDLPDTHLPGEEHRGSPMNQPSLLDSQDGEDRSQASLLSQLPDSQTQSQEESQEASSEVKFTKKY